MDKFSVLACMLMREASLKTKDSVYSMHLNFFFWGGGFWRKKGTLYTGHCGIIMILVDSANYIRNYPKFQTVNNCSILSSSLSDTVPFNDHCGA